MIQALQALFLAATLLTVPNPVVSFSQPGTYPVTLEVCNAQGCDSITKLVLVRDPVPSISSTTPLPSRIGTAQAPFTLSFAAAGAPPLSTSWTVVPPSQSPVTFSSRSLLWTPMEVGEHSLLASVSNPWGAASTALSTTVVPTVFRDVPAVYWAGSFIETLFYSGITAGCSTSPRLFCPTSQVSRAEMAVFLIRATRGPTFSPPAPSGLFADVPTTHWAAPWIEQLYRDGITTGCSAGPPRYFCPASSVSRAEVAVFLVRSARGPSYSPPAPVGLFADVPVGYWAAPWIEQLYRDGITTGCSPVPLFCPTNTLTRAEMAVFLVRAFNLAQKPSVLSFSLPAFAGSKLPAGLPVSFELRVAGGIPDAYDFDWNGDGSWDESLPFPPAFHLFSPGTFRPAVRVRRGTWASPRVSLPPLTFVPAGWFLTPPYPVSLSPLGPYPPPQGAPPGTPSLLAYDVQTPFTGALGYSAHFSLNGGSWQYAGLISGNRAAAADRLLLPPFTLADDLRVYLRPFTSDVYGPPSFPVQVLP
jgi:hypothetical protein